MVLPVALAQFLVISVRPKPHGEVTAISAQHIGARRRQHHATAFAVVIVIGMEIGMSAQRDFNQPPADFVRGRRLATRLRQLNLSLKLELQLPATI